MIPYYKQQLIELFSLIHQFKEDPFSRCSECKDIQEILIEKISYIEGRIRTSKEGIIESKRKMSNKHSQLSKEEASIEKKKIENHQTKILDYQYLLVIFRWIGDALVFSLFDCWDIKPFTLRSFIASGTVGRSSKSSTLQQ